jgi:hypothetical protein
MTIKCRTECDNSINYEIIRFSDGFLYFLPLESDGTIHDCPNFPSEIELDQHGLGILDSQDPPPENFMGYLYLIEEKNTLSYTNSPEDENLLGSLLGKQSDAIFLPLPFYKTNPELDPTLYQLTEIAQIYQEIGEYENASLALSIQQRITHDQTERILQLQKEIEQLSDHEQSTFENEFAKLDDYLNSLGSSGDAYSQKTTPHSKHLVISDHSQDNISVTLIRDKIRKVEHLLKSYIRKKYDNNISQFKADFPKLVESIEKRNNQDTTLDISEDHDIIGLLTLGESVFITSDWKIKLLKLPKSYTSFLHNITQFRNTVDHYFGNDLESYIKFEDKMLHDILCNKTIRYFDDLDKK